MRQTRHLVIFARFPELGTGKRRLAKDIGSVQALRIQRILLALTLRRLGFDRRWTTWLAVTPDRAGPWPRALHVIPQGRGDLGQRMARVNRALPAGPAVMVGSDLPSITAQDIARGFKVLGQNDAVIGPATDGGYWLIGLRRCSRVLNPFRNVRWSTADTLKDTLANLANRHVGSLDERTDVDDLASLSLYPRWELLHDARLRKAAL